MKTIGLLILWISLSPSLFSLHAQEQDFLTGVLMDLKTKEPLAFATIRVQGKAIGVISNQDGGFKVPLSFKDEGTVLEISSMGYETKEVPLSTLKTDIINVILVQAAILKLQETVVTAKKKRLSARKIIKIAIGRIPQNYPNDAFSLLGYYRDYQLKEKEYINLNEAIVQVFDPGFKSEDYLQTQYGILSYSSNKAFKIDSFAARPYDYEKRDKVIPDAKLVSDYGGNELVILSIHDAIRNYNIRTYSYVYQLATDFIKEHRFPKLETTSYNGLEVYKISMRKNRFPFQVTGYIYIDKDSFAIRKLDYRVNKEGTLLYEILVEYSSIQNKMYLNYISFHNKFAIRRPAAFRMEKVVLDRENGYLKVMFNKAPVNFDDLKRNDIRFYVKGRPLLIDKIFQTTEDELLLILSSTKNQKALRRTLFSDVPAGGQIKLFLDIKKLKDADGNLLNERQIEELDQFREFFTQKVMPRGEIPLENLMVKRIPLYDAAQPLFKEGKHGAFWKNSPLKTVQK